MALGIRSALARVDCGVLVVDEGRVDFVNPSLRTLFGLPAGAVWDGRPYAELAAVLAVSVEDAAAFRDRLDALAGALEPVNEDVVMNDLRVLEREFLPVTVDGRQTGHVSLYWDVSSTRSADRERLRRQRAEIVAQQMGVHAQRTRADEAEHAGRSLAEQVRLLAATDAHRQELLATASHELRTPLTSILGFSEMLAGELDAERQTKQYAEIINRNARSLLRVVDDLLLLAGLGSSAHRLDQLPCQVEDLLAHAIGTLHPVAEAAGVRVHLECTEGLVVIGDHDALARVAANVIGNAIKYSDRGGRVEVVAGRERDGVCIEVRDRGIGIPDDEVEQVFSQFFRASTARDSGRPGTGLGLAIAQSIVAQHGGTIDLRSALGVGTTVTLALPSAGAA